MLHINARGQFENIEDWLAFRREGIGASDVPAILGLSPFRTPLDVYMDKTGQAPDRPQTIPMRIGLALEPTVISLYEEQTGRTVEMRQTCIACDDDALFRCTLDGYCFTGGPDAPGIPVEVKTTSRDPDYGAEGTDEIPDHVILQCLSQLLCLGPGHEVCDVAVLKNNRDFSIHNVQRDDTLIQGIKARCRDWWDRHVARRVPPPPSTPRDSRHFPALFGHGVGSVDLTGDAPELVARLAEVRTSLDRMKQLETEKRAIEAELVARLGTHSVGRAGGFEVRRTLVKVPPAVVERKAYSYYRINIKQES